MKAAVWFLYDVQEIPRNRKAFYNSLSLDYFARQQRAENIRSFNLLPGQIPFRTGNTYTVWTRYGVFDKPEKIFSAYRREFTDIFDVLNHAREKNDAMIIVGADGADCIIDAVRASRMIFPQTFFWEDAVYFDSPNPESREFLSRQAQNISFVDAVRTMGGLNA